MTEIISTTDLVDLKNGIVLDCRPSAAYNGWPLKGEANSGHIPGAKSFPLDWFGELGEGQTLEKLKSKSIEKSKFVVITGYDENEMRATAHHLENLDFFYLGIHSGGMLDWASDPHLPIIKLPKYQHLVHPGWLEKLIPGEVSESSDHGSFVLAHVNFDNWGDYDEGHIPGSIWLDTLALEDERDWNHRSSRELEEELCAHGITRDTMVVLYGRTADPTMSQAHPGQQAGQLASMRAALLLMYAGIKNVRVLDGGLAAWIKAGGSITREETLPNPVSETGLKIPECPEFIVDTAKAKQMIADPNSELVSVRSWAEFIGEVSGYHYIQPKGRIPGAIFGNCGSDAYHMENYRNHDDTMRSYHEIEYNWYEAGITPEKHIAFYCGTGWRASEAFFFAWLMGWRFISIYDGGWYEWSSDERNPTETGVPK
ncbi:rhodanese-like domain-containing protein [Candidatus Neomarinimicrobiota bacterium]